MADELEEEHFSQEQKLGIVEAVVKNISDDKSLQKLTLVALKAFFSSIYLAEAAFKVQQQRDFIMERLFKVCEIDDDDIREVTMQILVDIARQFYDYIEFYYVPICTLTGKFAKVEEEKVSAQAIEIWTTLAEEEADRAKKGQQVKGYISQGKENLIQLLLECI